MPLALSLSCTARTSAALARGAPTRSTKRRVGYRTAGSRRERARSSARNGRAATPGPSSTAWCGNGTDGRTSTRHPRRQGASDSTAGRLHLPWTTSPPWLRSLSRSRQRNAGGRSPRLDRL